MAVLTGLEPAASGVTGRRYNQLNYAPTSRKKPSPQWREIINIVYPYFCQLFLSKIINYRGYIEGDRITDGLVDVIVTDGFTGNIALKTAEGTASFFTNSLKESLKKSIFSKLGYFLAKKSLEGFRAHMDPRKYNGAVLLGLNGIAVKSHGGTDSFGFANAISVAYDMAKYNFVDDLKKKLSITTKHLF